ncbi:MAG TPA: hypothetical protein VFV67_15285 [Actinophytocola sp.]|uniref:hypothetical protein n=1 Tax=Actinophytocola sp. TaxID=1872138 RepID=UPI002DC05D1D|nr:hypothetical protein [Actinophytocola sp.]HEU5472014.1 hypothetical protein [Actinophytocola sp.]
MVFNGSLTMLRNRNRRTGPDRLAGFLAALRQTPIPTSPPPHDAHQEALGLHLLALALRLEHIDRMSEALTLADSTHMARSVTIDIDMTVLTPDQLHALRSDPTQESRPSSVWLPVARQSRTDLAPVVVRNAAGEVVPRLTQVETAHALIHGVSKAFRMFLNSDPRTEVPGELLYDIRHGLNRSRWLIEATIANLIDTAGRHPSPVRPRSARHRATDSDSIRDKAATAVEQLFPADSPFLRLLDVAASEYLLVAQVRTNKTQAFLRYDAPVMPARSRDLRGRATIARWGAGAFRHEFTVQYATVIPRAVNSYHVTLEVPPEIQVRRFFLTSDVDAPALRSLVNDMHAVADGYAELNTVAPKLLELELQGIVSRLAEFGRRRYRDLEVFMSYIEDCYSTFSRRRPRFPARTDPGNPVSVEESLEPQKRVITGLGHLAHQYESDNLRKLAEGLVDPDRLRRWADALTRSQVHTDIYVDNDPRENAGHAHWQRRPFGSDPQSVEPVSATVYMALVDDPPSLAANVSKLLLAVLLLVVGFGVLLQPQLFAGVPVLGPLGAWLGLPGSDDSVISSADAIVTMLLLVPGVMLSRLDIPSGKSVLGQLRLFPRYVAYTSVIIAGALALAVAGGRDDRLAGPFLAAISALLLLAVLVGLDGVAKAVKRRSRVPGAQVNPNWLITEIRRKARRPKRCTANFSTVGSDGDTSATRAHPALAAVAARAASSGSAAVMFNVTHYGTADRTAPPAPQIDFIPPTENDRVATETLAFHPVMAGFQVHTWTPDTPHKPVEGVSINRISAGPRPDERNPASHLYHGSVVINPNFLYDPANSTEILITIGYDPWRPEFADSLMVSRIYQGIATAAADGGVPVLFLQSPVAPFRDPPGRFREDGSGEAPRTANGMALRVLVGLDDRQPEKRLDLLRDIAGMAQDIGLGLQIADRRFGRVRGEWWSVLAPHANRYAERKADLFGWAPPGVPETVQLVTFVGPARVGSSAALAADLVARNIGILAMSGATLQEIAFINVMLPIAPARSGRTPSAAGTCLPIAEGLGLVASDCGLTRRQGVRERSRIASSPATDYQVLSTGPVRPGIADPDSGIEHPLWLSWTVPLEFDAAKRPPDVAQLVLAQLCAASGQVTGGRVDYYRVRVLPDGRVRGRAKVSVTLAEDITRSRIPEMLSELCPWAQREVVATLIRDRVPLRAIRLRVAWRERWLGRVSIVM